jgi:isopentenyldiphosphate isomerase
MERAAVPWFGIKAYGVHINGFIRNENTGEVSHLWVARRSKTKSTFPGMLDHIVAGGQPYGISPYENVIKECAEEANIPEVVL